MQWGNDMARPNGSRKVRGWIITPKVAEKAGVSLTKELSKEDTDKLLAARKTLSTTTEKPKRASPKPEAPAPATPTAERVLVQKYFEPDFKEMQRYFGDRYKFIAYTNLDDRNRVKVDMYENRADEKPSRKERRPKKERKTKL